MLKNELKAFAAGQGFARTYVCALPDYALWRERVDSMPFALFDHLTDDPAALLPGDCRAVLMAWPYQPYDHAPEGATVSAYYPASDHANNAAAQVAQWLTERGFSAVNRPNIPYKPLAVQAGFARYGRNGVTAMEGLGSRYGLQVVLTDAPLEIDSGVYTSAGLSDSCAECGRCVQACPVGALDGTGRVDVYRCIRAKSEEYPLQEEYKRFVGRSLYGCDICQDVCPRNAGITLQAPPDALVEALQLEKLLAGEVEGLVPFIGKNYARKARMQAKGCVVAANMGRKDLIPLIEACLQSPVDFVRDHAQWALEQLK